MVWSSSSLFQVATMTVRTGEATVNFQLPGEATDRSEDQFLKAKLSVAARWLSWSHASNMSTSQRGRASIRAGIMLGEQRSGVTSIDVAFLTQATLVR